MPWKVFKQGEKYCVHKLNSDGSKGELVNGGCHGSKDEAAAQARALYASEAKELTDETLTLLKAIANDANGDKPERAEAVLEEWKSRIAEIPEEGNKNKEGAKEKEMYPVQYVPMGVFSFADLEKQRDTQEHMQELGYTMNDFQSLVYNIINQPSSLIEGGRIKALDDLYKEFRKRVNEKLDENPGDSDDQKAVEQREENAEAKSETDESATDKEIMPKPRKKDLLSRLKEIGDTIASLFKESEDEDRSSLSIWKEGSQYWWMARYSNKFRDDDNPREIISSTSHKRFVELVKEGKAPMPELWPWHVKQWKCGQAHAVAYDDTGFAIAIGTFDVGKDSVAEALMKSEEPIRVSHGMPISSIKRDNDDPTIIVEHETREISFLPAWAAANKLTGFAVLNPESKEESMSIPDETKQEWISKLGINPETLKSLEAANAADADKAISEGLESKEADPAESAQPATTEEAKPEDKEPEEKAKSAEETTADLQTALEKALSTILTPLIERITALETEVKSVKETNAAQTEAMKGTPTASLSALLGQFAQSAIGSPETQVDGRNSLAKSKPKEAAADIPGRTGIQFIDEMLAGNTNQ